MLKNKHNYDHISDYLEETINKIYNFNKILNKEQTTIFIRSYFSLLDSYISYNERQLNKKYINEYDEIISNLTKADGPTKYFKFSFKNGKNIKFSNF